MFVYVCMSVCMYVLDGWMDASGWMDGCIRMDGWMQRMDGWMHPDGWMDGCMHACIYVWSRVPCSRERELGGPYHWGGARSVSLGDHTMGGGPGIRDPDSYCIYIYIYIDTLDIIERYYGDKTSHDWNIMWIW